MPRAGVRGIEIEYDSFGDPGARPLLLVMGLGAQMIVWHEEFCELLSERGHYVIRFDNRDVGLSTWFDHAGTPNIPALMARAASGGSVEAPYSLWDMADDAAGLLDALGIPAAHLVGASMGGMIAQCLAVRHPERVLSLTSIMSTTGEPGLLRPTPEAVQRLMTPVPVDRDAAIEHWIATQRVIGGNGFAFDEQDERERFGRSYDRAFHPEGGTRQLAAIMASGPRREALRAVKQPALVIHGEEDPLVPVEGGIDTHEALGDSELLLIGGLGHSLPRPVWIPIADAIAKLAQRVP